MSYNKYIGAATSYRPGNSIVMANPERCIANFHQPRDLNPCGFLPPYNPGGQFGIRLTGLKRKRWSSCWFLTAGDDSISFAICTFWSSPTFLTLWPYVTSLHPQTPRVIASTSPLPIHFPVPSYKNTSDCIYGSRRQPRKFILSENLQ